jgi:sarcosine oxidase subunit beta
MGMDIIEQCEVKGVTSANGVVTGVQTTRGDIACGKLAIVWPGIPRAWPRWRASASPSNPPPPGARLEPSQALHGRVVMANTVHGYMSQSDKGEMVIGGGTDGYNAYTSAALPPRRGDGARPVETSPSSRGLKMLRSGAGSWT